MIEKMMVDGGESNGLATWLGLRGIEINKGLSQQVNNHQASRHG